MIKARINPYEQFMLQIASTMPDVTARAATAEEDCGHRKADMVINYNGKNFYFQISHTPKSRGEQERLMKRGSYPIATHRFKDYPIPKMEIKEKIRRVLLG